MLVRTATLSGHVFHNHAPLPLNPCSRAVIVSRDRVRQSRASLYGDPKRDCLEATSVGSLAFVESGKNQLGLKGAHRHVIKSEEIYVPRRTGGSLRWPIRR